MRKIMSKKFEVEIGTNGHIKYKGKIIAVLAQWNRFEDLSPPTKRKPGLDEPINATSPV